MQKLLIKGGYPLKGTIRLGGAKNASFKLMIASLLSKGEVRLLNLSHIADVENTKKIIQSLGVTVTSCGEKTFCLNSSLVKSFKIPDHLGIYSRASTMFIGPLVARFGKAVVPYPGGDKIGPRPLDRHFAGLRALGLVIKRKGNIIYTEGKLIGNKFRFSKNTHTGTETLLMAAVLAEGKTILENASEEPEVDELISFLNKMGAKIRRQRRKIEIYGVKVLRPVSYKVMPDRNEAVSYAIAAIISGGDVVIENARREYLEAFLAKLEEAGGGIEVENYGIRFYFKKTPKAVKITTLPHPGFMTDWQPLWAVLATQSQGTTLIIESVYLDRFGYVKNLVSMGAKINFFNPKVREPEHFYNFNLSRGWDKIPHGIEITGPSLLCSVKANISDLRAGATLVLAGLVAKKGQTVLANIEQIDRGYEDLEIRLRHLGANIKRV